MVWWMWLLFLLLINQRLVELKIARRNERWMKERGGIEKGQGHYKWFLLMHTAFFLSIIVEVMTTNNAPIEGINIVLFSLFACTQVVRIWCIYTLGRFWNTKIIVIPGVSLIKKGPYKFIKHPNYIIVGIELFIIPMLFKAYMTAFLFPILHIILLIVRIPSEERALAESLTDVTK